MSNDTFDLEGKETRPGLLLVDDEKNVLSALKRLFRKTPCDVFIANSGQEGLEVLAEHSIDVIISDARMPEMSGPEFLAVAAEQYPQTTRVLLTGYADMEAVVDAINLGKVSHYVEKPWDDEKLQALVDDALIKINLKKKNEHLQSLVAAQNKKLTDMNETLEATVKERTRKIIEINGALQENYKSTIDLFANLLDMRHPKSNSDVPDIIHLVTDMAEMLNLPQRELIHLTRAAKMRYMSQMSFADELLFTPYILLSEEQKQEYKQYPLKGATLLKNIRPLVPVADIILHHKEYLNGEGYPRGEKEGAIPKSAQILTVANDYVELLSGRMLESSLSHQDAIDYLESKSGTYYAADAVAALKASLAAHRIEHAIKDHCVVSQHLTPGMILARDLKNHNGVFLLPKGVELADSAIMLLVELEKNATENFQLFVDIPAGLEVPKPLFDSIQS
ncbi:MAG: HD domain-containing phosphohydrolase [Marinomonas sp.]